MKRILSVLLILVLVLSFAGCSDDKGRILYNVDLEDYITLGEYKGIKVDKSSKEFKTTYDAIMEDDVVNYGLYVVKKSGKVKNGDNTNIDYVGKKDGVAFEGGTAQGYDLTIGSGQFIPGFEEGLIGKEIGSTVDLDLTFPEEYHSADLAGAKVVFTVTINYVTTSEAEKPEEYHKSLGFASVEDYYDNVEQRAIAETLQQAVLKDTKVKDYPQTDVDFLYDKYYEDFKNVLTNNYGVTIEDYLTQTNSTAEEFKENLTNQQVKPLMDMQMTWYAIFDNEDMELKDKDKEDAIKEIIANGGDSSVTRADVIENYGDYYIEMYTISEKVFKFIQENAKIS